jgi:hypothetical protein
MTHEEKEEKEESDAHKAVFFSLIIFIAVILNYLYL